MDRKPLWMHHYRRNNMGGWRMVHNVCLRDAVSLARLRVSAKSGNKAAILPFYLDKHGVPRFVIYAPVPQRQGEHGRMLSYQIARGTMQALYRINDKEHWVDKGRNHVPGNPQWLKDESPDEAAMREAHEELGLLTEDILTLYDCGTLPYQNPRGIVYTLHTFIARITDASVLQTPDPYACAARLSNVTLQDCKDLAALNEAQTMISDKRPFKQTYLPLMEALHNTIMERCL